MQVRKLKQILADPTMQESNLTVELIQPRRPGGHHGGRKHGSKNKLTLVKLATAVYENKSAIAKIAEEVHELKNAVAKLAIIVENGFKKVNARINQVEANLTSRIDNLVAKNNLKE